MQRIRFGSPNVRALLSILAAVRLKQEQRLGERLRDRELFRFVTNIERCIWTHLRLDPFLI